MLNKFLRTPIATVALFALAAVLIGFGGVRGAAAAPRIQSADYGMQVELSEIGTALVENGAQVDGADTLLGESFLEANGLESAADFQVGKTYDEVLTVANTGSIDEYVRVTVRVYWVDANDQEIKDTSLKPEYIKLGFNTGSGWTIDTDASTDERTVLYYSGTVASGETVATPFATTLTIDEATLTAMKDSGYAYEGVTFKIDATVDAVQTHNGEEAMRSAWGRTN